MIKIKRKYLIKRKILSLLLCILMCLSLTIPSYALTNDIVSGYVATPFDVTSEDGDTLEDIFLCGNPENTTYEPLHYEIKGLTATSKFKLNKNTQTEYYNITVKTFANQVVSSTSTEEYLYKLDDFAVANETVASYAKSNDFDSKLDLSQSHAVVLVEASLKEYSEYVRYYKIFFTTGTIQSTVNKTGLVSAIAAAPDAKTDETYYHSDDRYNGTDTSVKGFWADMEAVVATARKVNENPLATQEEVEAATASLNRENKDSALSVAISKLIPITQINPTSLYEAVHPTWVWDYSQTSNDEVYDKDKLVSMKKVLVSAENCTEASWKAYTKAKNAAEDYLKTLFDEDGKPTAANVNDEAGTAQKNAEALAEAADPQQLVRKSLYETYYERYLKHREEAGLLLEQYNPEKLTQGDYDAASWEAYTKAYDTLDRTYRHKPSGGTKEDYGIYKAFGAVWDEPSGEWLYQTDALTATYNRLKTTGEVTVSFTYVNNLTASYPALSGGTDAYQKEEITLTGETNVYGLLKEANLIYASNSGIQRPKTESGNIMPDKSFMAPYFAIFVDGEFRGIYAGEEKAKSVNLKDKNKVTVVRVLQPQILNEASSGMDSTDWVWGDASRSEYQESLAMISVNPEKSSTRVGDKLTISAAVTDAYGKDLGEKKSAEGLTLFVSEPSENQVITSPGKNTGETTDTSGKASYTFARSGWYTIALHDIREDDYTRLDVYQNYTFGTYHSLVAGDIALIYVDEPENEQALIAQYRTENLAKAKKLFEQYQEYDFEDGYYKGRFTTCYMTLQEKQKSAKTFADLMERGKEKRDRL